MKAEMKRENVIRFRLSDGEKNIIEKKFKASNYRHLSDYLRCQAICGAVFCLDNSHFDYIKRQLAGACSNINQIAFQANKSQSVSSQTANELQQTRAVLEAVFECVQQFKETVELELSSRVLEDAFERVFENAKETELWQ